jgi:hypothetical protein
MDSFDAREQGTSRWLTKWPGAIPVGVSEWDPNQAFQLTLLPKVGPLVRGGVTSVSIRSRLQHLVGMIVYHLDDASVWRLSCAAKTTFRSWPLRFACAFVLKRRRSHTNSRSRARPP